MVRLQIFTWVGSNKTKTVLFSLEFSVRDTPQAFNYNPGMETEITHQYSRKGREINRNRTAKEWMFFRERVWLDLWVSPHPC